ncbi:MAG: O-Antigen ligase [Gaiellaceae bacterium]|nr:O-Antigen ligase [Gaiellaceae bacterium]
MPIGLAAPLLVALPFLFLHRDFQPGYAVHGVGVELSDLLVLAVAVGVVLALRRDGLAPLRPGHPLWIVAALFLGLAALASLWSSPVGTHLVTAAKYAEYAVLALALPTLARRREALVALAAVLVAWSGAATVVALAQFCGADIFQAWTRWHRQPSFLGPHDFAALSAGTLGLALTAWLVGVAGRERSLAWAGGVSGALGLVLSGAVGAALGLVGATAWLLILGRKRLGAPTRRLALVAGVTLVTCGGVLVLRGNDMEQFLRFTGLLHAQVDTSRNVQTYGQRSILVYIGLREFRAHPLAGEGWQQSAEPEAFAPYLADARRQFPNQPPEAFPSEQHRWGIQNAYVQALADLGLIGFVLLVALLLVPILLALRIVMGRRGPSAGLALAGGSVLFVVAGTWNAVGLVAGIPLDAALWLGIGLVALARELAVA